MHVFCTIQLEDSSTGSQPRKDPDHLLLSIELRLGRPQQKEIRKVLQSKKEIPLPLPGHSSQEIDSSEVLQKHEEKEQETSVNEKGNNYNYTSF